MAVGYLARAAVDDPVSSLFVFQKRLFIFYKGLLYDYEKELTLEAVAGDHETGYIKQYKKGKGGRAVLSKKTGKPIVQKLKGTVKIVVLD